MCPHIPFIISYSFWNPSNQAFSSTTSLKLLLLRSPVTSKLLNLVVNSQSSLFLTYQQYLTQWITLSSLKDFTWFHDIMFSLFFSYSLVTRPQSPFPPLCLVSKFMSASQILYLFCPLSILNLLDISFGTTPKFIFPDYISPLYSGYNCSQFCYNTYMENANLFQSDWY